MHSRIPRSDELVAAAKEALDIESDTDLAFALRRDYGIKGGQGAVNRWRNGVRGPSYEPTIALLQIAGWLNEDRVREAEERAATQASDQADEAEANRALDALEESPRDERRSA